MPSPPPPSQPSPTLGRSAASSTPRALTHRPFPRSPAPPARRALGGSRSPPALPGPPDLLRKRPRARFRRPYPLAQAAASADPVATRPPRAPQCRREATDTVHPAALRRASPSCRLRGPGQSHTPNEPSESRGPVRGRWEAQGREQRKKKTALAPRLKTDRPTRAHAQWSEGRDGRRPRCVG